MGKQKVVTGIRIWVKTKAKLSTLGTIYTLCQKLLTCAPEIIWRLKNPNSESWSFKDSLIHTRIGI